MRRLSPSAAVALAVTTTLAWSAAPVHRAAGAPAGAREVIVPNSGAETLNVAVVEIEGNARPVSSSAAATDWTVAIAVDPPLASATTAERAADLLGASADRLLSLGEVGLLVVDTIVDERLRAAVGAEAISRALTDLRSSAAWAEVPSRRAGVTAGDDPIDRLEAARDELQLVRWQREALVDWLVSADIEGPKALFLLEDAFDLAQAEAYALDRPLPTGSPGPALDNTLLGPTLAAAGWVVFPLALDDSLETVDSGPGLRSLAEATGGRIIASEGDLDRALTSLEGAVSLRVDLGTVPTGPLRLVVPGVPGGATPPRWIGGSFLPGQAEARARRFLAEGDAGSIDIGATLHFPSQGGAPEEAMIQVRAALDPPGSPPSSEWLTVALYLDQIDAPPLHVELQGERQTLAGVDTWVTQSRLRLPPDPGELVAVVADGLTGRWGAATVDDLGTRLSRSGPGLTVEQFDLRPAQAPAEAPEAPTVITLLAPDGDDLKGRQRFRTLVSSPLVAKVVFTLDGEVAATDEESPYAARIDLGREVARHTIRIDAFDVMGNLIGSDSTRLNEPARSFDVSVAELVVADSPPRVSFEAVVSHPTDIPVERVEFFYNERLLDSSESPPWSVSASIEAVGLTDYVRAVAHFADGRSLEAVQLLSALGTNEQVEVNLVQVYIVATDKQGEPVNDLTAEDFEIRLRGEPQPIERFAYADEVPLSLALVIDTSGSMYALMPDTVKAAARFLAQMVSDKDEAMIIDFGDQVRTTTPTTKDIGRLLMSLGTIDADRRRRTALYDSVIYSANQLPEGQGRKAIVLLSDGEDNESRFSLGRAIDTAKEVGAPVYVVSLVGIHDPRRKGPRPFITALTEDTGGEAFYLDAMSELDGAYDKIAAEMRSQYMLAFPTEEQLTQPDIESIKVRVSRPGLELRTVVGGRSVD